MVIREEERKEFEEAARPLIKFLNEHYGPHSVAIVDVGNANLYDSVRAMIDDYTEDWE